MELIRKSDALNAVLHTHGDAAVAAVQGLDGVEIVILEWCDQKTPEKKWQEYRVLVRNMPTIDDVQRGEWEERIVDDENPLFRRRFYCTRCGEWTTHGKTRFCPNCGAFMDRKEQTDAID